MAESKIINADQTIGIYFKNDQAKEAFRNIKIDKYRLVDLTLMILKDIYIRGKIKTDPKLINILEQIKKALSLYAIKVRYYKGDEAREIPIWNVNRILDKYINKLKQIKSKKKPKETHKPPKTKPKEKPKEKHKPKPKTKPKTKQKPIPTKQPATQIPIAQDKQIGPGGETEEKKENSTWIWLLGIGAIGLFWYYGTRK